MLCSNTPPTVPAETDKPVLVREWCFSRITARNFGYEISLQIELSVFSRKQIVNMLLKQDCRHCNKKLARNYAF